MKNKSYARVLALLLIAVLLAACVFLAVESDHDCAGEDCHICALLRACENTLRALTPAALASAAVLLLSAAHPRPGRFASACGVTPVTLKVRLLN